MQNQSMILFVLNLFKINYAYWASSVKILTQLKTRLYIKNVQTLAQLPLSVCPCGLRTHHKFQKILCFWLVRMFASLIWRTPLSAKCLYCTNPRWSKTRVLYGRLL